MAFLTFSCVMSLLPLNTLLEEIGHVMRLLAEQHLLAGGGLAVSSNVVLGAGSGHLAGLAVLQKLDGSLGSEILVVVVVDGHHGGVDTGSETLNLRESEEVVLGGLTGLDVKGVLDSLHDTVGATQLTGGGGTDLQMVPAHRGSVVHCVEGGHLIDSHGGHFQQLGHVVHDGDGGITELSLANVEKRHNSSLLVLRGVLGNHLLSSLHVLGGELKGNAGVVVLSVSVYRDNVSSGIESLGGPSGGPGESCQTGSDQSEHFCV
ncbi:uncharacterized protein YALI1_D00766g [Yarrowia lipolytica]|uniref:Uncharacterized protein n=1 Tax=Yarrowia lipolytica TaxID=4952 RepID=A0A1D8NCN5_YARLL|nr:hypothetical protein YALI1_D00766g [Yarrowia lipolytica]